MLKNESKPPVEDSSKIGGGSVIVEVKDTSSTTHYEGDGKAGNEPYQAEKSTGEFSYTSDTQDTPFGVSLSLLKRNMYLFIWLKAIGSYDSGAFSAVLAVENGMSDSLGLSTLDKGNLAASVFLGNIIGCPVAGHLFGSYNEQNVLNASLIAHTVATFLFAFFPGYYYCVFFRFFIGFTLAFIVVYTPVWVDHFAPRDKKSIWMASHNAGVPLGIMFGYLVGAYFPSFTAIPWEWAFYLKCLLMVPTIVYVGSANPRSLNARGPGALMTEDNNSDTSSPKTRQTNLAGTTIPGDKGVLAQLKTSATTLFRRFSPLIANPVFMCAVFAMSAMYLVATGLQNFVTEYLKEEPFNASILTIMLGFGAAVVTSPVLGVIVGGVLLDRLGGYHGNLLVASAFATAWGFAATIFSIICIFVTSTGWFLIVMSCVLFCGGAIIPPGAGITMSTLPAPLRSAGAAFAQTMYNLLGNYSGPLLCGFIAKQTGHLKYGIYTLFLCSLLGVVPMSFIVLIAWRRKQSGVTADTVVVMDTIEEEGGGGVDQEMAHVPPAGGSFSVRKENKEEVLPFSRTTQKVSPLESWRRGQERPARLASPPGSVAVEPSAAPTPLHTPKDSGLRTRESFLGMLDGSQEKSIPNQHAFGMDLVYSWLTAQEETERRRTASVAGRTNLHPLQADSVEMSPSVDSESRRRKNHNSRE